MHMLPLSTVIWRPDPPPPHHSPRPVLPLPSLPPPKAAHNRHVHASRSGLGGEPINFKSLSSPSSPTHLPLLHPGTPGP
eukprot:7664562-Pyramimonas_sp.AAC.1